MFKFFLFVFAQGQVNNKFQCTKITNSLRRKTVRCVNGGDAVPALVVAVTENLVV